MLSKQSKQRVAILCAYLSNRTRAETIQFFNFAKSTVYDVFSDIEKHVSEGNDVETFPCIRENKKRRFMTAHGEEIVAKVKESIDSDATTPKREIARNLGISHTAVNKIVKQEIKFKSYKYHTTPKLTEKMISDRLEKAKKLQNKLKRSNVKVSRDYRPPEKGQKRLIFFSDEKNFDIEQHFNVQNDRFLTDDRSKVPSVERSKFPKSVMVLGVVSNRGDVMPPFFFPERSRLTAEAYVQVLKSKVVPWMENIAQGQSYTFQQDGAPAHTAGITQTWLSANTPDFWGKEVWPPNSPDLNPLDYFVRSVIERDVNRQPHSDIASLKVKIEEVMSNLDRNMVISSTEAFRRRLDRVVSGDGAFLD